MLATALTVVLGTAPVTAFAADVDSTVTEAEQTHRRQTQLSRKKLLNQK